MRRARGLRVPATRDVCIFCATRQAAPPAVLPLRSSTQRRQLTSNSVSRAPLSSEQLHEPPPRNEAQPLSQAERLRRALGATPTPTSQKPPLRSQDGQTSQLEKMRASLGARPPQQSQSQQRRLPPQRRPMDLSTGPDGFIRKAAPARSAPFERRIMEDTSRQAYQPPGQSRFRVVMDSKPDRAEVNTPAFDTTRLRRRTEPPAQVSPKPTVVAESPQNTVASNQVKRRLLDSDEINRLLGNNSTRAPRAHQGFQRESIERSCLHCGGTDHPSNMCAQKPVYRGRQDMAQGQRQRDLPAPAQHQSTADAAEAWKKSRIDELEVRPMPAYVEERETRGFGKDQDRRRNKFAMEHAPSENRSQFEEPERRRGGYRNAARGRSNARQEDDEEDFGRISRAERKAQRKAEKKAAQMAKSEPTPIVLPEYISVANLAGALRLRVEDFVVKLEELGFEEVQNDHILNAEHAGLIAQEYNFEPVFHTEEGDGDLVAAPPLSPEEHVKLPARPPVVTIMGHVDHGKTTILDYMRSTSVAATEFGGITQHIGAFSVPLANGKKITFLDTPGHSAFETMRARGANVTDIVVLVVAADDSVMPQTVEAIKHAQAASVPIIVAINKIDKSQADPDAVKLDLGRHGIEIEDFGGDVQAVCVSGKTGQGIPDLEEAISTLSELLDHRADPTISVEGWVLEGSTKKSGRTATVLIRSGTLRPGTLLVAGTTWTRVRTLRNEAGVTVSEAGPGIAVEVDGWRDQPIAGDEALQADDEQHASAVAELRKEKRDREQMARDMDAINSTRRLEASRREAAESASSSKDASNTSSTAASTTSDSSSADAASADLSTGPELISLIIKGDVSGSVEALNDSLGPLGNAEVATRILRSGVGPPSEFDIEHAASANGHIVAFNTPILPSIAALAEQQGVKIISSNIIYRVVESVREALSEKLKPDVVRRVTGEAEVKAAFEIGIGGRKKMRVAGSKVRNGVVDRGSKVRVFRGETEVYSGAVESLKNVKKDVEQMRKDTECGIAFKDWEGFKVGDKIQCFEESLVKRTL